MPPAKPEATTSPPNAVAAILHARASMLMPTEVCARIPRQCHGNRRQGGGGTAGTHTHAPLLMSACAYPDVHAIIAAHRRGDVLGAVRRMLADPHAQPAALYNFPIRYAAGIGCADAVQLLLADPRVDPAAEDNEPIRKAALEGHEATVALLLADARVDPTAQYNAPFLGAAQRGRLGVVRMLLADARVDPAACDNKAMQWAAAHGHVDVVTLLLADPRIDPAATGDRAIRCAAENAQTAVVQSLAMDPRVNPASAIHLSFGNATLHALERATRWRRRRLWLHAAAHSLETGPLAPHGSRHTARSTARGDGNGHLGVAGGGGV
jgi:hypothetical protein